LNDGMGAEGPWRVFVSHTSELRDYPVGESYVARVERAISATGHVVVDMRDFPAENRPPAQVCVDRVRECDVHVGLLGTRYGSPVRDRTEVSYTQLEFQTATDAEKPRLVFLLDTDAADVGIPLSRLIDREYGVRQDAFRQRVRDSGLTTLSFASPAELQLLVERSLRELAETRRRVSSGVDRERVPAEPRPVRASKFINPAPATAPTWFQDRQVETGLVARHLFDPGIRLVTVVGRGGVGKTAMVCRLLKSMEAGRLPDVEGEVASVTVGGIVYLSSVGVHQVDYPTVVADLLRLLPAEEGRRLERMYQDPHNTPAAVMLAVLEAFPRGEPVVVLLDNLESVMDSEHETLREPALQEALAALLRAPAHRVSVVATTRVTPAALLKVAPAAQRQLRLDEGLAPEDARIVLRELDDDGGLGLSDAPDQLLDRVCEHTRGFPRALEAVKAILDADPSLTPRDLLERTGDLPEDQVVEELVGEAYRLLDSPAQQIMQALSVFPVPVTAIGVDYLLQPVNPTTNAAPVLTRLLRRQLVRFQDGHHYLHPIDRDYARAQLPPGRSGDIAAVFTLAGLQTRAADYFATIRTQRESWRTLDDIGPQMAEFELRCDTGDYDTAATVLADIDGEYLQLWGHYRTSVALHQRIHGRITDPTLNAIHLNDLGSCHQSLGDYRRAIDLHTEALAIDRETGNRDGEAASLSNLGTCHQSLGDYRRALDLHTEALAIYRETGNRDGEAASLTNLGTCHQSLGDYRRALDLHTQALAIDRETGNRDGEAASLSNLGACYYSLGDYRRALDLHTQDLAIDRETGNRDGEAADLSNLGACYYSLGHYRRALDLHTQALAIYRETGNRDGEAASLSNLGTCHQSLGDYRQALDLHTQALAIYRETGNRGGEAADLTNLGTCYYRLGDYRQAIDLHTQALAIYRETGNRGGEAADLTDLGTCYYSLGDYRQAIDLHTQALAIRRETGNRDGEAADLTDLGTCYYSLGDYRQALDLHTQALAIRRETGKRDGEAACLSNLGACHQSLGDYRHALDLHTQALGIAQETGNRDLQASALTGLGEGHAGLGDYRQTVDLHSHALAIAADTGEVETAALARSGLAGAHLQLAEPDRAFAAVTVEANRLPTEEPKRRLLTGLALLQLSRNDHAAAAFQDAIASADRLLALADSNVAALQARAVALAGLAVTGGHPAQVEEARAGLARIRAVTIADGVTAQTQRLLDLTVAQDASGLLRGIHAVWVD
jgi:tetratricopeptide (TPR) repeat protein